MVTKAEREAVLKNVEASRDAIVNLTLELIRIPSINPPGDYGEIAPFVEKKYKELGLEVAVLEGKPGRPNVVARKVGTGGGRTFLLFGHTDVVDAKKEEWSLDPWGGIVKDGRIWGRGASDMKSSLAAYHYALKAILDAGVALKGTIILGATVDDETAGKMGLRYVLREGLEHLGWGKPDMVLGGEVTGMNITRSYKGRLWYEVTLGGKSAHGAMPEKGISANDKAVDLINEVRKMEKSVHPRLGPDTINIGIIRGGTAINVVSDSCTVTFDVRLVPPRKAQDFKDVFEEVFTRLRARDPGFQVTELKVHDERDAIEMDPEHILIKTLQRNGETVTGEKPELLDFIASGDLYWVYEAGLVGAFMGPGGLEVSHSADEFVEIDKVVAMAKVYALTILDICG